MKAKRILTLVLSLIMVLACAAGVMTVFADEATDKFAPQNEEVLQMFDGTQSTTPLGSTGKGQAFGAAVTVPNGKRLSQINIPSLATYNNNSNHIVLRVYQWDTDYATTVKGEILALVSVKNHSDNEPADIIIPFNRNLTGKLLWTATYESGGAQMTPWKVTGTGVDGVEYFMNSRKCDPFCFSITVADEMTEKPASYTVTFMADGAEVATTTFYEGDTELCNVPECPAKEGFYADWESYTLDNADITVNAVYTSKADAVPDEIPDAANITAFAEKHGSSLVGEGCTSRVNRDGTLSLLPTWGVDDDIEAYLSINYCNWMMKFYKDYSSRNDVPNKSHAYNVIAFKVKAPAVAGDYAPSLTAFVGRKNIEVYCDKTANAIKCDETEEYWIFDFSDQPDFSSDYINTMKLSWAYSTGTEENIDDEMIIMGIHFFDSVEDALNATGGEKATEAPTEASTEAPTKAEGEDSANDSAAVSGDNAAANSGAAETEAPKASGCGAALGSVAVILTAMAAAVALKKKD